MEGSAHRLDRLASDLRPWTAAGSLDLVYDDVHRTVHRALLTDPNLLTCFRRRFPEEREVDYDQMIRRLDYVWDCTYDGTANVTGYRCAACGRTRATATARQFRPPAERRQPSSTGTLRAAP
jgi:hypothetical protein